MSNYNSLKTTIDANIKQNGRQEITGQILNSVLNQMVNILGTGYQFAGVATTATNPGTPDAKVFYITNGKGTYTNFGGLEVTEDEVVILYWDFSWHKVSTGIASQAKLSELESKVGITKVGTQVLSFDISRLVIGERFIITCDASNDIYPISIYADRDNGTIENLGYFQNQNQFGKYFESQKKDDETYRIRICSDNSTSDFSATFFTQLSVIKLFEDLSNVENRLNKIYGVSSTKLDISSYDVGTRFIIYSDYIDSTIYREVGDTRIAVGYIGDKSFANSFVYTKQEGDTGIYVWQNGEVHDVLIIQYDYMAMLVDLLASQVGELNVLSKRKITPYNFMISTPINMLDINNVVIGYLDSENVISPNDSYITSDYIEVISNKTYSFIGQRFIAQYDSNKIAIIGSYTDITDQHSITTLKNAKYIRVTFFANIKDKGIFEQEMIPALNVPYERVIPFIKIDTSSFIGINPSLNLLNIDYCDKGYYLAGGGALASNKVYSTSKAIQVNGRTIYTSAIRFIEEYDAYGVALKYTDLSNATSTVTLDADTKYIRVTYEENFAYKAMVSEVELSKYEPYSIQVPFIASKTRFSQKNMICFGDSITASVEEREISNWCMYVSDALGIKTTNVGLWSARVANVGADAVRNAFSLPRLVDSILSGDWSVQDIVYQTPGYEQHGQQLDKLKNVNFEEVDYISISLGTNDLASDTPFEIEGEPLNPNSVNGAFRYAISKLLTQYPHIKFIITTPIYRFEPSTGEDYMNNGRGIQDFVNDYLALGKELRVPVINMFNEISVNKYNKDYYWGTNGGDGLHPNHLMKELMGSKIAGGLNAML